VESEQPVACWSSPTFHFYTALPNMLGATLIRHKVVQVRQPREKRLLAPLGMMEALHHEELPVDGVMRVIEQGAGHRHRVLLTGVYHGMYFASIWHTQSLCLQRSCRRWASSCLSRTHAVRDVCIGTLDVHDGFLGVPGVTKQYTTILCTCLYALFPVHRLRVPLPCCTIFTRLQHGSCECNRRHPLHAVLSTVRTMFSTQ
jgi:hypothetical protein